MHDPTIKVPVSAWALRRVLLALLGPAHHIRELQATREPPELFPDNPINLLLQQYNEWANQPEPATTPDDEGYPV